MDKKAPTHREYGSIISLENPVIVNRKPRDMGWLDDKKLTKEAGHVEQNAQEQTNIADHKCIHLLTVIAAEAKCRDTP